MRHLGVAFIVFLALTTTSSQSNLNGTLTPIEHVIVIMQENHSFDNYFGTYPTANGTLVNDITSQIQKVNGLPNSVCLPYGNGCLSPYPANADSTQNPIEGRIMYERDYNNGSMDGFPTYSGPQSMAYFDYRQIPAYWDYTEEYGLADNYFASALTTTTPNRLLLLSGDTSVSSNYPPPPYMPFNRTILGQLSSRNITWGYFDYLKSYGSASKVYPIIHLSDLTQDSLSRIKDISAFLDELSHGSDLPSVNFVNSIGAYTLDEHPPSNVTAGELWTVSMVNAVMCSPYWNSSLILITYDEGGGYYDHVPPPQVLTIDHGFDRPLRGYGQRVPLLVISPYAKENYVSKTLLNHMSLLRFIDYNWNLAPLNENVAKSNNILDFFNFGGIPRTPIILGSEDPYSASLFPVPFQTTNSQPINQRTCSARNSETIAPSWTYLLVMSFAIAAVVAATFMKRRTARSHSLP
jgi:phospholipase C